MTLQASGKGVEDFVDEARAMYKDVQNQSVQIKALTVVRDSFLAEEEQMDTQIDALAAVCDHFIAQAEKLSFVIC